MEEEEEEEVMTISCQSPRGEVTAKRSLSPVLTSAARAKAVKVVVAACEARKRCRRGEIEGRELEWGGGDGEGREGD